MVFKVNRRVKLYCNVYFNKKGRIISRFNKLLNKIKW